MFQLTPKETRLYWSDKPDVHIASIREIPIRTVKIRLQREREKLARSEPSRSGALAERLLPSEAAGQSGIRGAIASA
jgi:hypothetical protein